MLTLKDAHLNKLYKVAKIDTNDQELESFLNSLGCLPGSDIAVVSFISESYVVAIKDGRYNLNAELASAIVIEEA